MTKRVDEASRTVPAAPDEVYAAFAVPGAMERWLPPGNMIGEMLEFDFSEGGSYRMRLTYRDPRQGRGKTSDDADEVEVRLVTLEPGRRIEQAVTFESEDPTFSGIMRMTWLFERKARGTLVTVRAEDVPAGIRKEDHQVALNASLDNLADFLQTAN